MTYLTEEKKQANADCVFCGKTGYVDDATDAAEWVVARSKFVFVMLNKFPYNNGHVMVLPYQHVPSKLVSPAQRGTICKCMWSAMPAPAAPPIFAPTLKPCGLYSLRRAASA